MQPTYRAPRAGGAGFAATLICFVLAIGLTAAAYLYWKRSQAVVKAAPPKAQTTTSSAADKLKAPINRAEKTLRGVEAVNKEGEAAADAMQTKANVGAQSIAASAPAGSPGVKLQMIMFTPNNPSAMINGKSVRAGDEVGGVKVLEVKERSVRVQDAAGARDLMLK